MSTATPTHLVAIGDNAVVLPQLEAELAGQVDIVYIDPPYDHGDGGRRGSQKLFAYTDRRETAWTDYIRDRLTVAKPLLSPAAPIAVSIGWRRVHQLAAILTEIFPAHELVTITIDQGRAPTDAVGVQRSAEYVLIAVPPGIRLGAPGFTQGEVRNGWSALTLASHQPDDYPNQHYPVWVETATGRVLGAGPSAKQLADGAEPIAATQDVTEIWPVTTAGKPVIWRVARETFEALHALGMVRADQPRQPGNPQPYVIKFVATGTRKRIDAGEIATHGLDARGALRIDPVPPAGEAIPAVWRGDHYATRAGTARLDELLGHGHGFAYPKSPALIRDIIRACTGARSDAVVLDFFAGSGSTLDAVHELNAADGGTRRAVLVQQAEGDIVENVLLPRVAAVLGGDSHLEVRTITPVTT